MTLCMVRSSTDNRSLWKQIMTVVVGSLVGYVLCLALQLVMYEDHINFKINTSMCKSKDI